METVVLLLSDKRSGSTMFQNELCKHPSIQHVAYSPHTYFETHHWLKGAVMLEMAPQTFAGNQRYAGYGSPANARSYMIDCVTKNVPQFQVPEDDRELIFQGWDALCEQFAQPVFFEKSPQLLAQWGSLSLLLEWIQSTDKKVRIIGLVRNPLSVQYSAHKLFHTNPEQRQFGWMEVQKNLLAFSSFLPKGCFMQVKYEDVITQPTTTFAEVCRFIGVPAAQEIGSDVHAQSLNKWKTDLEFTLRLDETVKQIARQFGYSDEELDNPWKPEPSRAFKTQKYFAGKVALVRARLRNQVFKPALIRFERMKKR